MTPRTLQTQEQSALRNICATFPSHLHLLFYDTILYVNSKRYEALRLPLHKSVLILLSPSSTELSPSALCSHTDYGCFFPARNTVWHLETYGVLRVNFRQPHIRPLDQWTTLLSVFVNPYQKQSRVMSVRPPIGPHK